jgi:hypothetical protein
MATPVRKHLVTIIGATEAQQQWVDRLVNSARAGTGDWPHPHPDIELTVVPLARFHEVMEDIGWQLTPDGPVDRHGPPDKVVDPIPDPNNGGMLHDAMHGLLGDFH